MGYFLLDPVGCLPSASAGRLLCMCTVGWWFLWYSFSVCPALFSHPCLFSTKSANLLLKTVYNLAFDPSGENALYRTVSRAGIPPRGSVLYRMALSGWIVRSCTLLPDVRAWADRDFFQSKTLSKYRFITDYAVGLGPSGFQLTCS